VTRGLYAEYSGPALDVHRVTCEGGEWLEPSHRNNRIRRWFVLYWISSTGNKSFLKLEALNGTGKIDFEVAFAVYAFMFDL